jgi:hypothetical protein
MVKWLAIITVLTLSFYSSSWSWVWEDGFMNSYSPNNDSTGLSIIVDSRGQQCAFVFFPEGVDGYRLCWSVNVKNASPSQYKIRVTVEVIGVSSWRLMSDYVYGDIAPNSDQVFRNCTPSALYTDRGTQTVYPSDVRYVSVESLEYYDPPTQEELDSLNKSLDSLNTLK